MNRNIEVYYSKSSETIATSGKRGVNAYRFGFQGQEKDDEIAGVTGGHLNYKYRMYDARLGRFFSIDPLTAEYPHNSPYAFSENRVIDGVELEGLEWKSTTEDNITTNTLKVKVVNYSTIVRDVQTIKNIVEGTSTTNGIKQSFEKIYTKEFPNSSFKGSFEYEYCSTSECNSNLDGFYLRLYDAKTITTGKGMNAKTTLSNGNTKLSETQHNVLNVAITQDGELRPQNRINRSFSHEAGHSAGEPHPWQSGAASDISQPGRGKAISSDQKDAITNNLMNSNENERIKLKSNKGTNLTEGQLNNMKSTIEKQQ